MEENINRLTPGGAIALNFTRAIWRIVISLPTQVYANEVKVGFGTNQTVSATKDDSATALCSK